MRSPISSKIVYTLAFVLLLVAMMAGCSDENGGVLEVCDNTPPLAGTITPGCGATGVPLNQKITATFNEGMDSSTVTTATFTLAGPTGTPVPGSVTYVSATNIATFTPSSNLATGTTYTYTIKGGDNGAKDMGGNGLAFNFACSFTTGAALDGTAPTVTSTDPANNATNVPLSKVTPTENAPGGILNKTTGTSGVASGRIITATFSEAMDPLTITASTFTVTGPGTSVVTGSVSYAGPSFAATFVPTNNLAPNTTYTGTITTGARDLAGNALAANYVWTFTTGIFADTTRPRVIATDPANNATGVPLAKLTSKDPGQGTSAPVLSKKSGITVTAAGKTITATFNEAMNPLTITSSTFTITGPGFTSVTGSVSYAGPSVKATFVSTNDLTPNTTYTGTITTGARDLAGNALANNYVWIFTTGAAPDLTGPIVTFTDPANGDLGVALNKKIVATFSEAMKPSTINATTFTLHQGTTAILGAVTYAGNAALFSPAINLAPNTVYTASIDTGARDFAGNAIAAKYIWNFTTGATPDITPPVVLSTDPVDNATGVALNKKIAVTYSEAMDPLTITTSTFTLRQGTTPVSGTLTYVGTIAVFTPSSNLAPNTIYTGTITTGAKDLAGNAMANDYVWDFTTAAVVDLVAPTVISTDPVNNAIGVASNKEVTATFSEEMDPSSITTSTVSMTGLGGISVTGTVSYAAATKRLTFKPSSNLASNTTFTVTIKGGTTGAKDLAGNPLTNNYVWSFRTADTTPPNVILTDPVNNELFVPLNKKIAATFSKAMKESTLTAPGVFTVSGPGITVVPGTVTYVPASNIAIFTPTANLAANTTFTATITTGAKDLAGNALPSDFVWSFTTSSTADVGLPTVTSTDPLNNAVEVPIDQIVVANFSEAMDAWTLTAPGTFTLMQGATPVTGVVGYSGLAATFTPESDLAENTLYTATITTYAKDLAGNALASDYVWSFTTIVGAPPPPPGQLPVELGTAARFAILSHSSITNVPGSSILGDVGLYPGTACGLTPPEVTGTIFISTDADPVPAMLIAAKQDALEAYQDAVAATRGTPTSISGNLNGLTLYPGLYESGTSIEISPGGFLYLDGQGDVNAVFVIRAAETITTESSSEVVLTNGTKAANVFWAAGTAVTLGTTSKFKGTVIASSSISLLTGANLVGRAIIQGPAAGSVVLQSATIIRPDLE